MNKQEIVKSFTQIQEHIADTLDQELGIFTEMSDRVKLSGLLADMEFGVADFIKAVKNSKVKGEK